MGVDFKSFTWAGELWTSFTGDPTFTLDTNPHVLRWGPFGGHQLHGDLCPATLEEAAYLHS